MRIEKLWIEDFKNLKDFSIAFDTHYMNSVLIGHNGTGKSNLIEAIVTIFKDLDLGNVTPFNYELLYSCRNHKIQIISSNSKKHPSITVDGKKMSLSKFCKVSDRKYLPKHVFAYYSGPGNRLETLFDDHQSANWIR